MRDSFWFAARLPITQFGEDGARFGNAAIGLGVCIIGSVLVLDLLMGCASPGQNLVRSDASRRFSCPESRVDVEDLGPRTARASGCGQSALYSCEQARASLAALPQQSPLTEGEATNPTQPAGACSWVIKN